MDPHYLSGSSCNTTMYSKIHQVCVVHHRRVSLHILSLSSHSLQARTTVAELFLLHNIQHAVQYS